MDFKKTLLIICLFIGLNTVAQNRLEFNQVLTIDSTLSGNISGPGNYTQYSDVYTVPNNKTWKIEFLHPYSGIMINNVEIGLYGADGSTSFFTSGQIWLKDGDEIRFKYSGYWNGNGSNAWQFSFFLSAIEFNIVTD